MDEPQAHIYEFGGFRLDTAKHLLLRGFDEIVPLMPKAFDTLHYLVRNSGKVIEKDELMREIWTDTIVEENNLTQNISILRRVLGEKPGEHRFIVTVPGHGYKFVAEVHNKVEPIALSGSQNTAAARHQMTPSETRSGTDHPIQTSEIQAAKVKGQTGKSSRPTRNWLIAAFILIISGSGLLGFYFWRVNERSVAGPIRSVAVLPFINISQDPNAEYLSDGIAESVINNLSQVSELKVMSRNSAFRFKNDQTDTRNIAAKLGVETLITGDIRQIDDKFVINVRLIDAGDESQIWGSQYVRTSADMIAVQNEITKAVVQNLRIKLTISEQQKLSRNYTANGEAYQLYLRGRFHVFQLTPPEVNKGISYLQEAIDLDPNYALAYAGISDAYRSLALGAEMTPTEYLPKSKAAANKAIEIDDALSEGHSGLGMSLFWGEWDWSGAETQYKRAFELNPNDANAHIFYAHLLSNTGRYAEALAEAKIARELDPLSPFVGALEGQFLLHAGQIDEAITRLQKTFELAPNFWMPHIFASSAYIEKGMYREAIAEARKARELSPVQTNSLVLESYALAKSGKRIEAEALVNALLKLSTERFVPPCHIAQMYNGLDERDKTFEWLERGFEQRDPKMAFLKVEPKWASLRSDPRFVELMRKMNFE